MKESKFIDQNFEKWQEFENDLRSSNQDPHKTSKRFIQTTDDLSYAQTFYRSRTVRVYLNAVAQIIFGDIYKNRKVTRKNIADFWRLELPLLMYEARKEMRLSFFLLIFSVAVGVLSSIYDPDFARHILGDSYVDMTIENIEKGDPMAVYKQGHSTSSFIAITLNNLKVDVITFFLGISAGIGTIYVMISNGIMLGAFQYFFIERGLFWESFLTIWQHGTLEISGMVIAGASGLTMAKGLVFPGTYSRSLAFRISAQRGLRILMGVFPVTIIAGFIEGYETQYTDVPDIIRLMVIILSLSFIIYYFVLYPKKVYKSGKADRLKRSYLLPKTTETLNFARLKLVIDMFGDSFALIRRNSFYIIRFAMVSLTVFTLIVMFFHEYILPYEEFAYEMNSLSFYFSYADNEYLFLLQTVFFSLIILYLNWKNHNAFLGSLKKEPLQSSFLLKASFNILALSFIFNLLFFWDSGWSLFFGLLLFPYFSFVSYAFFYQKENIFSAFSLLFKNFGQSWWRILALYLLHMFVGGFFLVLNHWSRLPSGLSGMVVSMFEFEATTVTYIYQFITVFILMSFVVFFCILVQAGNAMLFHAVNEVTSAEGLRHKIKNIGNRKILRFENN